MDQHERAAPNLPPVDYLLVAEALEAYADKIESRGSFGVPLRARFIVRRRVWRLRSMALSARETAAASGHPQ